MLAGSAWGSALGAVAALLYIALDPNLRPIFGGALVAIGPRWIASFLLAGAWVALLARALPSSPVGRRLAAAAGAGLPLLGLAIALLSSPATPWTLVPGHLGAVFLANEMTFAVGFAVLALVAAWPLGAWARRQAGRSGGWTPMVGLVAVAVLTPALVLLFRNGVGVSDERAEPNPARSLVIIGIDGGDWQELSSLIDRGVTPHLAKLVARGASGPLTTFRPTQSPIIWTTIATGQTPHRHGIQGFLERETEVPYTSNARRVPALWNLLGDRGVSVGVVGWWITWPAEPVNGTVVSYHATPGHGTRKGSLYQDLPHQTHPPELMEGLRPTIAPSLEAGRKAVEAFDAGYDPTSQDDVREKREFISAWGFGTDRIFSAAAIRVLESEKPRFLATYFAAVDVTSHAFCSSNPWRDRICGKAIDAAYGAIDRQIGEILAAADPNATVIVLSDHGFDRIEAHETFFPPGPDGILILAGEGLAAGSRVEGASVYDITPTILALFGLPVPYDLRGRPLLSAFESDFIAELDPRLGPSDDPHLDPDDPSLQAIPAPSDADFKDRLRALGYIE
jgi:hypothetical protein